MSDDDPAVRAWFLAPHERDNPSTQIDRRRGRPGEAHTTGNEVHVLVHGADYFTRLLAELRAAPAGAWVHFTDWRGDPDERLDGPGTAVAGVLAELAERGVAVRGLVWRSHADQAHFSEQENLHLVDTVNEAGGEVLLDERVRRDGSHHQKLVVIRHPGAPECDVAFVGGIDLSHGRRDDAEHAGDPQAIELDDRYGSRPAWHDIQLEVRGPAVADLAWTFRERWEDPTPIDHRNPLRSVLRRTSGQPKHPDPLPAMPPDPAPAGPHAVQVLRTYPAKKPAVPFAPDGERSIARAYLKAFGGPPGSSTSRISTCGPVPRRSLADRLREEPQLHLVAVVPRYPDQDGRLSGPPNRIGQQRALEVLRQAGGDRVVVFDLEAPSGRPIYVHAKVCIVDDTWMIVGSDNLNLRSWTNDSELSCAVLDSRRDEREPRDPGGHGDGARLLARDTRLRLWREHLDRADGDDADIVDAVAAIDLLRRSAAALDAWHDDGRDSPRPGGRLRMHRPEPVTGWQAWWAQHFHRFVVDPDGRPRALRKDGRF